MSDYQRYPIDKSVRREKQLGQARPADTNAVSIYSPSSNVTAIIKHVVICNSTVLAATYRLFLDVDGTTYSEVTAHSFDVSLAANTSSFLEVYWIIHNQAGNIAVRSGTANALTFSVYGEEITRTADNL